MTVFIHLFYFCDIGTIFIPQTTLTEADIRAALIFNLTPPLVPEDVLQSTVDRVLELYPDDPAVGSPFNTGNETFGMPGFKRAAAICESGYLNLTTFATETRISL